MKRKPKMKFKLDKKYNQVVIYSDKDRFATITLDGYIEYEVDRPFFHYSDALEIALWCINNPKGWLE